MTCFRYRAHLDAKVQRNQHKQCNRPSAAGQASHSCLMSAIKVMFHRSQVTLISMQPCFGYWLTVPLSALVMLMAGLI